jgi:hypothetical protein
MVSFKALTRPSPGKIQEIQEEPENKSEALSLEPASSLDSHLNGLVLELR